MNLYEESLHKFQEFLSIYKNDLEKQLHIRINMISNYIKLNNKKKIDFPGRTARQFMKATKEFEGYENGTCLLISKVYALLDIPSEGRTYEHIFLYCCLG